jgi:hypothetical protein
MAMSKMHSTCLPHLKCLGDLPLSLEKRCHAWMRVHPKKVATIAALVVGFAINLPLVATGKPSFQEAKGVCYDRNMAKLIDFYEGEEWEFSDHATRVLFPLHLFNSLAAVTSLFGFLMWLFFSTYRGNGAEDLDRTSITPPPPPSWLVLQLYFGLTSFSLFL